MLPTNLTLPQLQPFPQLNPKSTLPYLPANVPTPAAIYLFGSAMAESSSSSSSSASSSSSSRTRGGGSSSGGSSSGGNSSDGQGFRNVMELAGLDALQATINTSDWKVVSDDELPGLERRIQDMLRVIEEFEVPDIGDRSGDRTPGSSSSIKSKPTATTSASTKDKRKTSRGNNKNTASGKQHDENAVSMRLLAEDFMELPLDSIPNYASLVPRMLSIEVCRYVCSLPYPTYLTLPYPTLPLTITVHPPAIY